MGSRFLLYSLTLVKLLSSCFVHAVVIVGTLPREQHGVSGQLEIVSTTEIRLVGFSYDGGGPAAFLYYYAPGQDVRGAGGGSIIPIPNLGTSEGRFVLGLRYSNEELTVSLPAGVDVCDIGTFTIWCRAARSHFTRLVFPRTLFESDGADPCRLKGTGTTQAPATQPPSTGVTDSTTATDITTTERSVTTPSPPVPAPGGHENCVVFDSSLQLAWTVNRNTSLISFMLLGCQSTDLSVSQYMGFGLSGSNERTSMDGADVTIAWIDNNMVARAVDYHLQSGNRVQCRAGMGVCPDAMNFRGTCRDDVVFVSGFNVNREQRVSFTRPFTTSDTDCDLPFNLDTEQYIVWAVGGVEETAFKHFTRSGGNTAPLRLGRSPLNQCQNIPITCEICDGFPEQKITATPGDIVFRAHIGPSGNNRGYMAITGQVGWGIAWYINDLLIPKLEVQRGTTYTFIVNGGNNPDDSSNYHPFYITDSPSGGYLFNTPEQRAAETIYAGFDSNGNEEGIGRLCTSVETTESYRILERCGSLEEFTSSFMYSCRMGQSGMVVWTPDENTPDTVYYQCATHRNLGWKISVIAANSTVTVATAPMSAASARMSPLVQVLTLALFLTVLSIYQ